MLGIAIVGYSDNVLTARSFAARHHYNIDANQELLALGLANLGAGLMQGFLVSSSGSRTVIGDTLGSKTQLFSLVAMGVVIVELLSRLAHPHDAVQGTVANLPGLHDIDDWEGATTIPGLVIYRYDAPLCFANAEDFKCRALKAIESEVTHVEWFVLNTEAIAQIDITALDMLEELADELADRGITFAMARVKQDLYAQLKRCSLLHKITDDRIYLTLHTMIMGFKSRG